MAEVSLLEFDSKRFAVSFSIANQVRIFRGLSQFLDDAALGPILRIEIESKNDPGFAFIVEQSRWRGEITPDVEYGCDFLLRPNTTDLVAT